MLCNNSKLAQTSSTPGKTKLVNHFLINDEWYLVDLPGYGYAKLDKKGREAIRKVVDDYILGSEQLACLFVLIDSRHDIGAIDVDFIRSLGEHGVPFCIIFTKTDKIGPVALSRQIERDSQILLEDWESLPKMLSSSSAKGTGREEILSYMEEILKTL